MDQLKDLRDLVAELREDNRVQKEKTAREGWTKYVSLSMILVAVLTSISGGKGGGYSSGAMRQLDEATFLQSKAVDQWSYYEAKSLKQTLAENELERIASSSDAKKTVVQSLTAKVARYDKEKAAIFAEGKNLESQRDRCRTEAQRLAGLGGRMGLATSLFQLSIALGGVCLIMKRRVIWWLSLALGAAALARMIEVLHAAALHS